jgi:hypothetical protein
MQNHQHQQSNNNKQFEELRILAGKGNDVGKMDRKQTIIPTRSLQI